MNDEGYRRILARLERWARLGTKTVPNGTRLIGHIPHVAPLAYLHQVYPGLTPAQIDELESTIRRPVPEHHRAFLRLGNGISLFMQLRLNGLRFNFDRDPDASRQPFKMETPNVGERPRGADPRAVFIGGYCFDGSGLFTLPDDPRIYHCPRREAAPILNSWPSLESLLNAEIDRFESLMDERGRLFEPEESTAPEAGTYR